MAQEPVLRDYPQLPAVWGDLLQQLDHWQRARIEFERAASLTRNTRERSYMLARAAACTQAAASS